MRFLHLAVSFTVAAVFVAPMALAIGSNQPSTNSRQSAAARHDVYRVRFVDAHGHIELDTRVAAGAGAPGTFTTEQDHPYIARVMSGQPLTPDDLAIVKTGVWGKIAPLRHDRVTLSVRVAELKSMKAIADKSVSTQPITPPDVVGRTVRETVRLTPGTQTRVPIGMNGVDGTLTVARD